LPDLGLGLGPVEIAPPVLPLIRVLRPAAATDVVVPLRGPAGAQGPPGIAGDAVNLSHLHTQADPSSVWLIVHGLTFVPSGVVVTDHAGARHHPRVSYPDDVSVRLEFDAGVYGTARLS
jgi:hypothetical protein